MRTFSLTTFLHVILWTTIPGAYGQQGDRLGEDQPPLPHSLVIPASPALSATDALGSFTLPENVRIELVAAEPLVIAPVMSRFGPDGRLWVVEMPGYMNDLEGSEERSPSGRIIFLEDIDQNGQMDTRTVFLDGLVLPRSVAPVRNGVLVIAPPNLLLARDTDGDGTADDVISLDSTFGGLDSPEHAGNGLMYGMDNWFHCSQHPWDYRYAQGSTQRRAVQPHGQWGLAADEWNTLFYSPNSYPLMTDIVPRHVLAMNPAQQDASGTYLRIPCDQTIHASRINPGVNRAYREGTLGNDHKLTSFTAACGPEIYLDTILGEEFEGDAFICEPAGNTVEHRNLITKPDLDPPWEAQATLGAIVASNDERFRPVHLQMGPDGALYISDMYRGILQHKIFMTSFLRQQIIDRGLETPIDRGRLWRVVPATGPLRPIPDLTSMQDNDIIDLLEHPNGTTRLLAQQRIVEKETLSKESLERLEHLCLESDRLSTRAHAMWSLEGRSALSKDVLRRNLSQPSVPLILQSLDVSVAHLDHKEILQAVLGLLEHGDRHVRRRAGAALHAAPSSEIAEALAKSIDHDPADQIMRTVVIAAARGHEILILQELGWLDSWRYQNNHRAEIVRSIVRTILRQSDPAQNLNLLEWIAAIPNDQAWLADVAASELVSHQHLRSATPKAINLSTPPFDWHARIEEDGDVADGLLALIDTHTSWPGRPGYQAPVDHDSWTGQERLILNRGAALYASCVGCHQASGRGLRGFYPPLADSPLVVGHPEPLLAILIRGMEGPVTIHGVTYDQPMPPAPFQNDADLAAIASFIRSSFDNAAPLVSQSDVVNARKRLKKHTGPVTMDTIKRLWPE